MVADRVSLLVATDGMTVNIDSRKESAFIGIAVLDTIADIE